MASPGLLDVQALPRDLSARERADLRAGLRGLLRFHRTLARWPALRAPRATPIVAIYAGGVLRGCALHRGDEAGADRLARAFLAATSGVAAGALAAQVFYPRSVRWLADPADLDVGREGIALVRRGVAPVLLMPQVARDHGVHAHGMLELLLAKAGLDALPAGARLVAWTVETVVARDGDDVETTSAHAAERSGATAADYAAAWLVRMVDARGKVAFAIDPRTRVLQPTGPLWHARSAIAIEALAAYAAAPLEISPAAHARVASAIRDADASTSARRARSNRDEASSTRARGAALVLRREAAAAASRGRRWLGGDVARALRGLRVPGWPDDRASVIGTLALACLAGVPVHDRLRELVRGARASAWPWHAGQVALALGRDTPRALWQSCIDDLAQRPFAPYFALAAKTHGDEPAYRRAAAAVASFIRRRVPHVGGAAATALPEAGLTAVAAHALAGSRHRAEHAAALAFLHARQLLPDRIPAALDPTLALGGFSATPVDDTLRADIAGHALLALI